MIAELKDKILNLSNDISLLISECPNLNSLEEIRINALGKKGFNNFLFERFKSIR